MIVPEVERVISDLKRATSYSVSPETAEAVLERVTDDVCKIIERIEDSNNRGMFYKSIYPAEQP